MRGLPLIVLLAPMAAIAQEREIFVGEEAGQGPPIVRVRVDVPVVLIFDAPLRREAALVVPSADVRRHPYLPNALEITPAAALADRGTVPVRVPLVDGVVTVSLSFSGGVSDHVVQFVRRQVADAGTLLREGALERSLGMNLDFVFEGNHCRPLPGVEPRTQAMNTKSATTVCVADALSYVRVQRKHPSCAVATAVVRRDQEFFDLMFLERAATNGNVSFQRLVLVTPDVPAHHSILELRAVDGTLCEEPIRLDLGPKGDEP